MIQLELAESDLFKLVRIGRELSGAKWLDHVKNFRLPEGNTLAVDLCAGPLSTTVRLELSPGPEGELRIALIRLADNPVGNFVLRSIEKLFLDDRIVNWTRGALHRVSPGVFSLDAAEVLRAQTGLAVEARFEKAEIADRKLRLGISVECPPAASRDPDLRQRGGGLETHRIDNPRKQP